MAPCISAASPQWPAGMRSRMAALRLGSARTGRGRVVGDHVAGRDGVDIDMLGRQLVGHGQGDAH